MPYKSDPANQMSIDDLIVQQASLQLLTEKIAENGHQVPKEVADDLGQITRELNDKLRGDRERRLAVMRQRRLAMSSIEEKRNRLDDDIKALENQLGVIAPTSEKQF